MSVINLTNQSDGRKSKGRKNHGCIPAKDRVIRTQAKLSSGGQGRKGKGEREQERGGKEGSGGGAGGRLSDGSGFSKSPRKITTGNSSAGEHVIPAR